MGWDLQFKKHFTVYQNLILKPWDKNSSRYREPSVVDFSAEQSESTGRNFQQPGRLS